MKKFTFILLIYCLFVNLSLFSQVGIGTGVPDSSAILELQSTQRGFLPPRMTTEERDSIQNPAIGLIIYNLDCHCINFFNGDQWVEYGRDPIESFSCGQVLTDSRTGRSYNTILIGNQCWMAENLDVGEMINNTDSSSDNAIIEKYCYGNAPGNCSKLGALYRWNELMQYDTNRYNQGICPEGWHLPNTDEWDTLVNYYGGQSTAGAALKEEGISGFEALLAGGMKHDNSFYGKGSRGYFWSSVSTGSSTGWAYNLNDGSEAFNKLDTVKQNAYPVRCIKGYPNRVDTGVVVIDSTVYTLISDSAELAQGIYRYTFGTRSRDDIIVVGNTIVGLTGMGYLRNVNNMDLSGNQLTLETSQATLEDVFVSCEFLFQDSFGDTTLGGGRDNSQSRTYVRYLAKGVTINHTRGGIGYNFSNVSLINNENISLTINGSTYFAPHFKYPLEFHDGGIKAGCYAINAPFNNTIELDLEVNTNGILNLPCTLAVIDKIYIPPAPILIVLRFTLMAYSEINVDASFTAHTEMQNTNHVSFGLVYDHGTWDKIWNVTKENTFELPTFNGQVNIGQKVAIVPEIDVLFYGIAGPYFNIEMYDTFNFGFTVPSFDWNSNLNVGIKSNLGVETILGKEFTIFGYKIPPCSYQLFGFEKRLWEVPSSLEIISGNNQTGVLGQPLSAPLVVKVKDSEGVTFANIPVHFVVASGGGSVEDADVMTDANGYAQTNWTLGPTGSQQVSVSVLKANGDNISGSPKIFNANSGSTSGCGGSITINHVVGDVAPINKTVTYGTVSGIPGELTKCWITSNLGADHQANAIDDATEASAGWYWQFNRMQGYKHDGATRTPNTNWISSFDENSEWLIANDPCAIELGNNWRLPTSTEWTNVDASGNWNNSNDPWNSVLKLHPAGYLHFSDGSLQNRGSSGRYWSNTQLNNLYGLNLGFAADCHIYDADKALGITIRCIKDSQTEQGEACPGTPTVTYEGQVYNTVQIGTQCWLKENLNVGTMIDSLLDQSNNGIIEKYCIHNSVDLCDTYGGLYNWDEMMQYTTTPGTQGICPTGWHLPTDVEWLALRDYLGGESVAGGKMKETGTTHWLSPNTGATNESGFTALPAGYLTIGNYFDNIGYTSFLYSSVENSSAAYSAYIPNGSAQMMVSMYAKYNSFSVRCVKN